MCLLTGNLAQSFAMNMQQIARGWLVYTLTSSPMALAWVTMSFALPQVLFSLWGGVMADRFAKRRVLAGAQMLNCVATLAMAAIIITDHVTFWHFIWFGVFNGTILASSAPARWAFVPELIPRRLIFTGMALNTTGNNLARILGPAFAGFLIAWAAAGDTSTTFGVGIVYFVIAALYFVSATSTSLVRNPGLPHLDGERKSSLYEIKEGLRYVRAHPPVFGLIMLTIVPFLFGMPLNTLIPAFNEDILGGGPDDLGLLMSAMGIGAIVGSLMLAASGDMRHKGVWLIATSFGWAAAIAAFGFTGTVPFAMLAIAMVGWASAWNMSLSRGLLQMQVDGSMRGRIMSIDMFLHGLMPLGIVPISLIAEAYDVATALVATGVLFALLLTGLVVTSTAVRRVDEGLSSVKNSV